MKPINSVPKDENLQAQALTDEILIQTVARLHRTALGIAVGILFGSGIFLATNILILSKGNSPSPNLALINHYFFGYSVTFGGSFIGLLYGFASGFLLGWLIAFLRNLIVSIYLYIAKFKARIVAVNKFIDYP